MTIIEELTLMSMMQRRQDRIREELARYYILVLNNLEETLFWMERQTLNYTR